MKEWIVYPGSTINNKNIVGLIQKSSFITKVEIDYRKIKYIGYSCTKAHFDFIANSVLENKSQFKSVKFFYKDRAGFHLLKGDALIKSVTGKDPKKIEKKITDLQFKKLKKALIMKEIFLKLNK